ncbi:MAG: Calx-beta domain-containing protein [Nitrospirota bacterium]
MFGARTADAAVGVLDAWPATPQLNGTTGNLSGTFTISAGANRLLVVAVDCQDTAGSAGQTFSATYGGRALTQAVIENSNRRQSWIGYLREADIAARTGDTLAVTVTGAHTNVSAHIASYQGVDQTAPITGTSNLYLNNANPGTFSAAASVNAGGYGIYTFSSNQARSSDNETYTEHSDYLNGLQMGVASKAFAAVGTTQPAVTYAANARVSQTLITVNPAPAGSPGSLQLSSAAYSVNENGGTVVVTATRTGGSSGSVSVSYATADGTATSGSDYTAASGTLVWADGDAADKTFSVTITNDGTVEADETFTASLSGPTGGAALGSPSSAVVTIVNDDIVVSPGSLQLSSTAYSVNENGGAVTITVTRAGGSSGAVGVSYATANGTAISGSDYAAASGTLAWADGDAASKTFSVTIINDGTVEANETFTASLGGPTGGASLGSPSSGTVTIADDDGVPPPAQVPAGNTLLFAALAGGMAFFAMRKNARKKG